VKRSIRISLVVVALATSFPVSVLGANPSDRKTETVAQLESRADQANSKLARLGPPQRADVARNIQRSQLRNERDRLRELIGKLEAGQQVSPAEIDRVLGR
jgi:hypothetical protein